MLRLLQSLTVFLGLALLAGNAASAFAAAGGEKPASGSAAVAEYLVGNDTRLSEEAARENPAPCYDFASDSPVAAEGAAWTAPTSLVRVIPGVGPYPTLGLPGAADVFVTTPEAIQGLDAAGIAERLTIDPADQFTVIQFSTPDSGLASPVFRTNPGFIQGGFSAGGAPEFVIPNGPIPAGATITVVQ
jgi:hypothetical protein